MEPQKATAGLFECKPKSSSIVLGDHRIGGSLGMNSITGLAGMDRLGGMADGFKSPSLAVPSTTGPREGLRAIRCTLGPRPEPDVPRLSAQSYCIYDCNTK